MLPEAWQEILAFEAYGVSVRSAGIAFGILFVTFLARRVLLNFVFRKLHMLAERSSVGWDEHVIEALRAPLGAAVLLHGVWAATRVLLFPLELTDFVAKLERAREVLVLLIITWTVFRVVGAVDTVLKERAADPEDPVTLGVASLVGTSLRVLVVLIFGTVLAQNLGYSVSGLIASLGVGGAALALASKDMVANLFGFLMILIDRPFRVGDWIKGNGFEGVVEEVGFRSTRIRTFGKTVENIPNNVMANVNVENMDRRRDPGLNVRRISMTIGVTYSTSAEKVEAVVQGIRDLLKDDPGVDKRMTILVNFTGFAESSLDIFIYYFSDKADWDYYLGVRERVNLKIMRLLESLGVEIAFPSRSLYLESIPPEFSGAGLPGAAAE